MSKRKERDDDKEDKQDAKRTKKKDNKKVEKEEEASDTDSADIKAGEDPLDDLFCLPADLPTIDWLEYITLDSTITLFGKRNTGKSFYARYLLSILQPYFPWGYCLTNTPHNGWWQNMIPEKRIYTGWRPDLIIKIMEMQLKRVRDKEINPFIFIILDDIVSDNALRYDPTLRKLYYEGRHYKIFILICSQYVYGLPPGNRANTDFMITFTQHQRKQIQQLQEDYCSEYKNWQYLKADMDKILGDFECLIVDQRDPNLRGVERYFKDVATEVPDFSMGTHNYWEGSDWEQQLKDWAPMPERTMEEWAQLKTKMEYEHSIDDSGFEESNRENESSLLTRIMDYGGKIPNYF
jgi:hypothetical protein